MPDRKSAENRGFLKQASHLENAVIAGQMTLWHIQSTEDAYIHWCALGRKYFGELSLDGNGPETNSAKCLWHHLQLTGAH
jgi:hypothetical protein